MKLSNSQLDVVRAPIGSAIQVLASAGSGKTRVLTERVRYILENTNKDAVIALTFTNKAAEEMARRLDDIEELEDRCWITTIHAVAKRVLDQYGHTIGLPEELHIYERDQDRQAVFLESLRRADMNADALLAIPADASQHQRDARIQDFMSRFSGLKRAMVTTPDVVTEDDHDFWCVFQAYQEALLESGGIDFDDILVYAHRVLLEQPWTGEVYRAKYKHVCVDEAQDLNKAQYEFIRALCGDTLTSLMMVGDPNQMIYGFNGSSNEYLLTRFPADFTPSTYRLTDNYRSSAAVIEIANLLLPNSQLNAVYPIRGRVEAVALQDEDSEAEWIANRVLSLIAAGTDDEIEGAISLDKMVVIARNRFVFGAIQHKFKDVGIDFSLNRGERQVEPSSVFGRTFDLAIRLKLNPKDWIHGERLCRQLGVDAPPAWGSSDVLNQMSSSVSDDVPLSGVQSELLRWVHDLDNDAPAMIRLFDHFESTMTGIAKSDSDADGELERSVQELKDARQCWRTFRERGLGETLMAFRNSMALGQVASSKSNDGITLSTVHTMKGLERDIVFLAGLCEGVFPDYRARSEKDIAEERNSAFVAVTRSRRWIYLSYPQSRKMPWGDRKSQRPSRFLDEMGLG